MKEWCDCIMFLFIVISNARIHGFTFYLVWGPRIFTKLDRLCCFNCYLFVGT
jgi:hypothetical protein